MISIKNKDVMSIIATIDGEDIIVTPFQYKVLELLERIANK